MRSHSARASVIGQEELRGGHSGCTNSTLEGAESSVGALKVMLLEHNKPVRYKWECMKNITYRLILAGFCA